LTWWWTAPSWSSDSKTTYTAFGDAPNVLMTAFAGIGASKG
jgi:hypothetical protein